MINSINTFAAVTNSLDALTQGMTSSSTSKRKSATFILPNDSQHDNTKYSENEDRVQCYRNTDPNVHYKNQSECLLCGTKAINLTCHYVRCHPKQEVVIARPSPDMADKLRFQNERFTVNEKRQIVGICYFCDEIEALKKSSWRKHILNHTGEKRFTCTLCNSKVNYKKQHDSKILRNISKCEGILFDICEANSSDGSYVGFMCNDCNYIQIKLDRMIQHLTKGHDYDLPTENHHYQKLKLLPSI